MTVRGGGSLGNMSVIAMDLSSGSGTEQVHEDHVEHDLYLSDSTSVRSWWSLIDTGVMKTYYAPRFI